MRYGYGNLQLYRDKQGHHVVAVGWAFRRVPEGVDLSEWQKRYKRITRGCHIIAAVALATSVRGDGFLAFAVFGLLTGLGPIVWLRSVTQEWVSVPASELAEESFPLAAQRAFRWRENVLSKIARRPSQPTADYRDASVAKPSTTANAKPAMKNRTTDCTILRR